MKEGGREGGWMDGWMDGWMGVRLLFYGLLN